MQEKFKRRAIRRNEAFKKYKSKVLLGCMKTILHKPEILKINLVDKEQNTWTENCANEEDKEKILEQNAKLDSRIEMLSLFMKQYYLTQIRGILKKKGGKSFAEMTREDQHRIKKLISKVKDDELSGSYKENNESAILIQDQVV